MESLIPNYKFFLSLPYYIWAMPCRYDIFRKFILNTTIGYFYISFPILTLPFIIPFGILLNMKILIYIGVIVPIIFLISGNTVSNNENISSINDMMKELHTNTVVLFRTYKSFLWSKISGKKFVRFDFIQDSYITNEGLILKQGWIMKDAKCIQRLKKYEN